MLAVSVYALLLGFAGTPDTAVSGPSRASSTPSDWLVTMGEYFAAHPELRTQRGSGWKPYNRMKWFVEQRRVDGDPIPADALWRAWERTRLRFPGNATTSGSGWFSRGPTNLAGRIMSLAIDPNDPTVLYAGSAGGGLWKSTNSGAVWMPIADELPSPAVGAVVVLPSDSDVILIGTGQGASGAPAAAVIIGGIGILKSTDAGSTWQSTSLSYPTGLGHAVHEMQVNPITGVILAAASDGVWRSTDDGDTWTQVRMNGDFHDVCWKPGDANRVYVGKGTGSGTGVHLSTDGGATFVRASGQPLGPTIGRTEIAISPAVPTRVYAYYTDPMLSFGKWLFISTNEGASWTQQAQVDIALGQAWHNLVLEADPADPNLLFGGGVLLHRSTDAGVTWSVFQDIDSDYIHVDHQALVYRPGSTTDIVLGTDQGIWETTNSGVTWTPSNEGLVTYQFYDVCAAQSDPDFAVGGTQDNGTDRWTGTTAWSHGLGADGMVCNIDPADASRVYGEIQFGGHHRSTDAGENWTEISSGIPAANAQWVVPVALDQTPGNAGHLYTAHATFGGVGSIYRTTNAGDSWIQVSSVGATWIDLSPVDGDVVWSVWQQAVQVSTDDGGSWTSASPFGFATGNETKILAHPTNPATAYVTFSGYGPGLAHVAKTTDFGATWTDLTAGLPEIPVNAIAVDTASDLQIFVGTDLGVWSTTDGGATWAPFGSGLPNAVVHDLEIRIAARKLLAGTHGRGAWEADLPPAPTGVAIAMPHPSNLMLDPPRPNPAAREVVLRWAARHPGRVELEIHDVRGRLVTPVASHERGDGVIRSASWITEDHPAGVYFALLRAGSEQVSRKVVVTR
jgi:hypothetical protein